MKKIAAILLILLLSFNWYGYRIVISLMQDNADKKLESRIDNLEYDESQLVEISVPLNNSYQERFTDFERHYGEIEIGGKLYTYVKSKIAGDVAIFKCIANQSKQELSNLKDDFARANSAIETDHNGKQQQSSSFAKNFWSEYDGEHIYRETVSTLVDRDWQTSSTCSLPVVSQNTPHQPPEC